MVSGPDDDTIAIDPSLVPASPVVPVSINESVGDVSQDEGAMVDIISSNIFFDANSAYLKDSELTKIQKIADAVAGAESRLVKIQGLEDLASSNDFKVLLASRRVLAVKKKLGENGVGSTQISINEIQLSEEGRVLDPPSLVLVPA